MKHYLLTMILLFLTFSLLEAQNAKEEFLKAIKQQNYENAQIWVDKAATENPTDASLLMKCGNYYFDRDDYQNALNMYILSDKAEDGEWVTLSKIAETNSLLGNHAKSFEYFEKALKRTKERSKDYFTIILKRADAYIKADSSKKAELEITRVKNDQPNNPLVYMTLGNLYFSRQIYELAMNNYREALKTDSTNLEARINYANSLYWLANSSPDEDLSNEYFNRCLQEWNNVSSIDPKNAKAWKIQGKIFYYGNRYVEAAQALTQYVKLIPSDNESRWWLGRSLYEINRCDSARTSLEYIAKNVDSLASKANAMMARCFLESKDYKLANEKFEPLYKSGTLDIKDKRRFGQSLFYSGDTLKAFKVWEDAIKTNPKEEGNCQLMVILTQLLSQAKKHSEAINIADIYLSTSECKEDNRSKILFLTGTNYIFLDTSKTNHAPALKSLTYLKEAISIDSNYVYSWLYIGDAYVKLDSANLAVTYFEKAISIAKRDVQNNKPQILQSFNKICGMMLGTQKYPELEKYSKEWSEIQPDVEWPWLYWAFASQGKGDYDTAKKNYRKVLQINPNNNNAKKSLKQLEESGN